MFALSLALASAVSAAPPKGPTADDYVGRWNVKITNAEDTFVGGGFSIEKAPTGLVGGVVWRWGSYGPAKVAVANGTLTLTRDAGGGKTDVFEARLEGSTLVGQAKYPDGKTHAFEGRRAPVLDTKQVPSWGEPVTLFDGRTLDGWSLRDPNAKMGWAVVDGDLAVVAPKGNADLVTSRSFGDMKLHIEFDVEPGSNSGVYLRGRYEIQILDDKKLGTESHGCGALYSRVAPKVDATKAAGEWQAYDITLVGRQLTVVLNGTTVIDNVLVDGITGGAINPYEEEPGPLMLQGDHGKVRFRNIVVTPAR